MLEDETMKIDSATMKQWVDLELDGELEAPEAAQLARLQESEPELLAEKRALQALHHRLSDDRIDVEANFSQRVMNALPARWWESRSARASMPTWLLPVALMVVMALGSAWALGGAETGPIVGLGGALVDFVQATFLAGAGMLFATWRGVGWGLEQFIADSGLNLLVMALAIGFLNLLFFSLLRRPARESADTNRRDG